MVLSWNAPSTVASHLTDEPANVNSNTLHITLMFLFVTSNLVAVATLTSDASAAAAVMMSLVYRIRLALVE